MLKTDDRICLKLNREMTKWVREAYRADRSNLATSISQFCVALIGDALMAREPGPIIGLLDNLRQQHEATSKPIRAKVLKLLGSKKPYRVEEFRRARAHGLQEVMSGWNVAKERKAIRKLQAKFKRTVP